MHRRHLIIGAMAALMPALGRARTGPDDEAVARYDRERRYMPLPQGRIAYIDRGAGEATLFLHGFPLSSFQWREVIELMSASRRCLAPDFLGLGRTEVAPGQGVGPLDQAAMLVAFLDRLAVDAVHVVANDSGGAVAQLLMAYHPERVRTVLLTNCDTEIDSPPKAMKPVIEMARAGTYADRWLVPWVSDKALARSKDGLGGMCYTFPDRLSDTTLDEYLRPLTATPERKALTNRYALALESNSLKGMTRIFETSTIPVAVVWGKADTIFSSDGPDYLSGTLPYLCRVRMIADGKLFFPEEYPNTIAAEALKLGYGGGRA